MKTDYQKIKMSINKYHRSIRGLVARMYSNQRQRCRDMSKKLPKYNLDELHSWILEDKNFLLLYEQWVKSGYNKELTPSIDKKNPLGDYEFSNIQVMTWKDNMKKGNRERNITQGKRITQSDLKGKKIKDFISITDAGKETGIDFRQISSVLCGRNKTAKGYIFNYQ
jgi:hypothetical protein